MKIKFIFLPIFILIFLLSACSGDGGDISEEGFDFTDEGAVDALSEEGFDFSNEQGFVADNENGFVFDEDEMDDPPRMDFDDDEALYLPDLPEHIFPPGGVSNWLINHHDGTAICPNQVIPIWGNEPVTVTINVSAEAQSLVVSGMEGGSDILFVLDESGPGGSRFQAYFQPPGASSEVLYQILFYSLADGLFADNLLGEISGKEQECKISRSFDGYRID